MTGMQNKERVKNDNTRKSSESLSAGQQLNNMYSFQSMEDDDSFKMPLILWLLLAPFIGLFYGIYLPLTWIAKGLRKIATLLVDAIITRTGNITFFSWNPVKVYFLGKKESREKDFSIREDK